VPSTRRALVGVRRELGTATTAERGVTAAAAAVGAGSGTSVEESGGGGAWTALAVLLIFLIGIGSATLAALPHLVVARRLSPVDGTMSRSARLEELVGIARARRAELVALSAGSLLLGLFILGYS
jgi:hypothetical protein